VRRPAQKFSEFPKIVLLACKLVSLLRSELSTYPVAPRVAGLEVSPPPVIPA
jgi:hypothetical protein